MVSKCDLKIFFILNILCCIYGKDHNVLTKLESNPRIINGTIANWNGTRYQVSVRLKEKDWFFGSGHICGGSLISANAVLTAAHCIWDSNEDNFRNASEFSIVLGNSNRFLQDNNSLVFNVSKISLRNEFSIHTYKDDIAILFLDGEVPASFTRSYPIALNDNLNIVIGTLCTVSGWGKTELGFYSAELRMVNVEVINRTKCIERYGDFILDGMICAGYMSGGRDACQGDSGGPLVCEGKLVGVVSFGEGCALPDFPGVYTGVASYISWIHNEIGIEDENAKGVGSTILLSSRVLAVYLFLIAAMVNEKYIS